MRTTRFLGVAFLAVSLTTSCSSNRGNSTIEEPFAGTIDVPADLKGSLYLLGKFPGQRGHQLPGEFDAGVLTFSNGEAQLSNHTLPNRDGQSKFDAVGYPLISRDRLFLRYLRTSSEVGECFMFESNLFGKGVEPDVQVNPTNWATKFYCPLEVMPDGSLAIYNDRPSTRTARTLFVKKGDRSQVLSLSATSAAFSVAQNGALYFSQENSKDLKTKTFQSPEIYRRDSSGRVTQLGIAGVAPEISFNDRFIAYIAPTKSIAKVTKTDQQKAALPVKEALYIYDSVQKKRRQVEEIPPFYTGLGNSDAAPILKFWSASQTASQQAQLITLEPTYDLKKRRARCLIRSYDSLTGKARKIIEFNEAGKAADDLVEAPIPNFHFIALAANKYLLLEIDSVAKSTFASQFVAVDINSGKKFVLFQTKSSVPTVAWHDG